jgi:hypothetical protein
MIFVGIDWAEAHHEVCVLDEQGALLARRRILDSLEGIAQLHALIGECIGEEDEPGDVLVGIEKDRGLIVAALVAADYRVYAINPKAATESVITSPARSQTPATPRCWRTWFAPIAITTARWPATACSPRG